MANAHCEISNATLADIPKLITLFSESEKFHRDNRPDFFSRPDEAELTKMFAKFLHDPATTNLKIEVSGALEAYARFRIGGAAKVSFLVHAGEKQAIHIARIVSYGCFGLRIFFKQNFYRRDIRFLVFCYHR